MVNGVGDVIAGKYRIEQVLGRGGMGYVVSAMHTQLDQRVAIKFMVPELCEHPEAVARFLREARAAVRIRSEHVARVLDVGTLDDGTPYMVMEFLLGRDLATELEDAHHLQTGIAVNFILQACEALAEAHAAGIVHRDLKPANLFLTRRPDGSALVKVLDFGISKAVTDESSLVESLTASQSLIGSPYYMSPEQVRRPKMVDRRSDIWALGVILHELLSGDRPFGGDTPMSVLAAVVSDPAPSLRGALPELPSGLERVILCCLEKDPDRRYPNVVELAQALRSYTPAGEGMVHRIEAVVRTQQQGSVTPREISVRAPEEQTGQTLPSPVTPVTPIRSSRANRANAGSSPETSTDFGNTSTQNQPRRLPIKWLGAGMLLASFGGLMFLLGRSGGERPPEIQSSLPSTAVVSASPTPTLPAKEAAPKPATEAEPTVPPVTSPPLPPSAPPPVPRARLSTAKAKAAAAKAADATRPAPSASISAPPPSRDPLDERR